MWRVNKDPSFNLSRSRASIVGWEKHLTTDCPAHHQNSTISTNTSRITGNMVVYYDILGQRIGSHYVRSNPLSMSRADGPP
jgi:hypothetical protein